MKTKVIYFTKTGHSRKIAKRTEEDLQNAVDFARKHLEERYPKGS